MKALNPWVPCITQETEEDCLQFKASSCYILGSTSAYTVKTEYPVLKKKNRNSLQFNIIAADEIGSAVLEEPTLQPKRNGKELDYTDSKQWVVGQQPGSRALTWQPVIELYSGLPSLQRCKKQISVYKPAFKSLDRLRWPVPSPEDAIRCILCLNLQSVLMCNLSWCAVGYD